MREISRRGFLKLGSAIGLSLLSQGCNSQFYETKSIRDKTEEIIKTRDELISQYIKETGSKELEHPKRRNESWVTINENNTYTLTYEVEFGDQASLEKMVKEQIAEATISSAPEINQMIITLKQPSQLSFLENILSNSDRLPPQILLKFSATADFGDIAKDYATKLSMELKTTGGDLGSISDIAKFPGALERLRNRIDMGAQWGAQVDTSVFDLKAVLDTLESWGYARHVFETYLVLANGKKGILSGIEKLPIPEQILAGVTPVVTQKMESLESNFEGTAVIYDELVRLNFTAGVSNAKRPDIKRADFLVPATDKVTNHDFYVPIGMPTIIGGKLIEMELGVNRRDAILRGLSQSKDYEKRLTRIYYEVTPYRIVKWTNPEKTTFKYRTLESSLPINDPNNLK